LKWKRGERRPTRDPNKGNNDEISRERKLYVQTIVSLVIILVVFAVGSAMMSSILKIMENHAQNRINQDPTDLTSQISEKIKYPKDLSYKSLSNGNQMKNKKDEPKFEDNINRTSLSFQ